MDTITSKNAFRALTIGIAFSVVVTAGIWLAGGWLDKIPLGEDQGPSWYVWKLITPNFVTRLSAWGSYFLHQISFWAIVWYAQTHRPKYSKNLHKINIAALAINGFFILWHFVQTHLWYDGLAQDVSVWSSQMSVVIMLVWVLILENRRRGIFFGKKLPFPQRLAAVARVYHGYYFAWAIVYTFWYHPMIDTTGHLIGFLYIFFLLLQGSLMFTRVHVNRWWTLVLEVSVLLHGTLVAIGQGAGIWPMFAFGFGGIFVITQMHGLGWSKKIRSIIVLGYIGAALGVYATLGIAEINAVIRIPMIDYVLVILFALVFGLIGWLIGKNPTSAKQKIT